MGLQGGIGIYRHLLALSQELAKKAEDLDALVYNLFLLRQKRIHAAFIRQ